MTRAASSLFVAVEGADGAGKTTLAAQLAERLAAAGYEVIAVREPGGTPAAEHLRALVLDAAHGLWTPAAELFLMLAARAELVAGVIGPALEREGHAVVSDRFDLSTEVYQVAGRGLPRELVLAANRLATGGLKPDLTIVLDVPQHVLQARRTSQPGRPDRIESEDPDFHRRVAEAFRAAEGTGVVHIDGAANPRTVADAAWAVIERCMTRGRARRNA